MHVMPRADALWTVTSSIVSLTAIVTTNEIQIQDARAMIENECPVEFREAVCRTGRLLYRGEDQIRQPTILAPPPDLLELQTYGDTKAVEYFRCLENRLTSEAKPSMGHIATARWMDAAVWASSVVSIWPLNRDGFSYVWPRSTDLFFPPGECLDDYVENEGLEEVLRQGKEILWATNGRGDRPPSSFLAVPQKYDSLLLNWLS